MATLSSILAWEIPWTEQPGGLQSVGSQRVRQDWAHTHTHTHRIWMLGEGKGISRHGTRAGKYMVMAKWKMYFRIDQSDWKSSPGPCTDWWSPPAWRRHWENYTEGSCPLRAEGGHHVTDKPKQDARKLTVNQNRGINSTCGNLWKRFHRLFCSDVILFGLYSNPLTCAAWLFSSPLDKNKTPKTGRWCKYLKVRGSLTTGAPSFYPQTNSSSSHRSPEHGWVFELGGKKVGKWPWKPQSQSRQGQRCQQPPLNNKSRFFQSLSM